MIVLFLSVDFSGDQPKTWTWRDADGRSDYVVLAANEIRWDHGYPGPRIATSPRQFGPLRHFIYWDAWVLHYRSDSSAQQAGSRYRAPGRREFVLKTGPLFLLSLLLPLVGAVRLYRRHRPRDPGRCRTCGYDLRATPDRCPECGQVPASL